MKPRVFQAIDLDRTLFNTARFLEVITSKVNDWEPGLGDEIEARFEAAYKREETFFALDFLRDRFGNERYDEMVREVTAPFGVEYWLMPGAKLRLAKANELTSLRPSYGIVTYAQNADDQMTKLRLIGLEAAPVVIVDTPDKGAVLESWRQPNGTFLLPQEFGGQSADYLTLEDDKLRAFTNLPKNVFGAWLTQDARANERLRASGVTNTLIAEDLAGSFLLLKEAITRF